MSNHDWKVTTEEWQRLEAERQRREAEKAMAMKHEEYRRMMEEMMRYNPPPKPIPNPLEAPLREAQQEASQAKKTAEGMLKITNRLMQSIRDDLLAIRKSCVGCECGDLPGADCPKMTMKHTMNALVQVTIESMGS